MTRGAWQLGYRFRMALLLALLALAAPASAQDRGFFAKVLGKTFVVAFSAEEYDLCEFKDEGAIILSCKHNWDGTGYERRFRPDNMVEMASSLTTPHVPQPYELRENGLILNGKTLWFIEPDGSMNEVYRSSYQGKPVYSQQKFVVVKNRLDPRQEISQSAEFYRATSAEAAEIVEPVYAALTADIDRHLGKLVRMAPEGPRLALVIGNARYGPLGDLANPVRDATLIADSLRKAGFDVEMLADADQRSIKSAIQRFGQRLRAAGPSATGLFFFTGHGMQWQGANYLIPVGAAIESEADVDLEAVTAEAVLSQIEQANIATSIIILDACRNVPTLRADRAAGTGLARMDAPNGSYIAYATAPGRTATDGRRGTHSPFAAALAREMAKPGQPIETMFRNVRSQVYTETAGKQTPWDSSSLFRSFYFTPAR